MTKNNAQYLQKKDYAGFTLIELVIVIAGLIIISGILITVLNIPRQLSRARDSQRAQHLKILESAINNALGNGSISLTDTTGCVNCASHLGSNLSDGTGWVQFTELENDGLTQFVNILPRDPLNDESFHYNYFSDGEDYEINAVFELEFWTEEFAVTDGGNDNSLYEVGSNLTLN